MKKNLLSMLMFGTAMLFACCTPNSGNEPGGNGDEPGGNCPCQVTVSNITLNSADLNVTVTPEDAYYYLQFYTKAEIEDAAQGDYVAVANAEMTYWQNMVQEWNDMMGTAETILTFYKDYGVYQGSMEGTLTQLRVDTEYVILHALVNETGFASEVHKTEFKTLPYTGEVVTYNVGGEEWMGAITPYGNWYENGTNNFTIELFAIDFTAAGDPAGVKDLFLDLVAEENSMVGTFVASEANAPGAGSFVAGIMDDGEVYSTAYVEMDYITETYTVQSALNGGSVTVTEADGIYTVTGELTGMGTKIVVNYQGELELDDTNLSQASVKTVNKFSAKHAAKTFCSATKMVRVNKFVRK